MHENIDNPHWDNTHVSGDIPFLVAKKTKTEPRELVSNEKLLAENGWHIFSVSPQNFSSFAEDVPENSYIQFGIFSPDAQMTNAMPVYKISEDMTYIKGDLLDKLQLQKVLKKIKTANGYTLVPLKKVGEIFVEEQPEITASTFYNQALGSDATLDGLPYDQTQNLPHQDLKQPMPFSDDELPFVLTPPGDIQDMITAAQALDTLENPIQPAEEKNEGKEAA